MPRYTVLDAARKHLADNPKGESSARFCLAQAVSCQNDGALDAAHMWGVKSLAHSVGVFSSVYRRFDVESRLDLPATAQEGR